MSEDWICRNCGQTINGEFAQHFNCCSSLTGCGSKNIRLKNDFDDLPPVDLSEALQDISNRLYDLETLVNSTFQEKEELSKEEKAHIIEELRTSIAG